MKGLLTIPEGYEQPGDLTVLESDAQFKNATKNQIHDAEQDYDSNIRSQSRREMIPQEQEIDAYYDGNHDRDIDRYSYLSAHRGFSTPNVAHYGGVLDRNCGSRRAIHSVESIGARILIR